MDLPDQQRRRISSISDRDEHVAMIGGPNAPIPEVLAAYASSLALLNSADDVHIYGIDLLGRGLAPLEALPHCGGMAIRNEALALRIVRHLIDVAAERKVAMAATGSSNIWEHAEVTGELPPQEVLLVSGTDRLLMSTEGRGEQPARPVDHADERGRRRPHPGRPRRAAAGRHQPPGHEHRASVRVPARRRQRVRRSSAPASRSGCSCRCRAGRSTCRRSGSSSSPSSPRRVGPRGRSSSSSPSACRPATARPPRPFADVSWPQPWEQAPIDRLTPHRRTSSARCRSPSTRRPASGRGSTPSTTGRCSPSPARRRAGAARRWRRWPGWRRAAGGPCST